MTFHESTVSKLRGSLAGHQADLDSAIQRVEFRRQKLADAQVELDAAEEKVTILTANVADCQRWLDFAALCDVDKDLAHAFANAVLNRDAEMQDAREPETVVPNFAVNDLVNVSDPTHKHFGVHGSIVGFVYDPDGVVVEYDNLGNTLTVADAQLTHHTEFVKQSDEYFANAEQAAHDAEAFERHQANIARDTEDGAL